MRQPILLALLIFGPVCGCRQPQAQESEAPGSEPAAQAVSLRPLSLPPVSTFEDACARCHGPEGSFYGEGFAKPAEGTLTAVVREMMEGPASLTPSDADVDAMVAYHRALAAGEPFLCVTAYQPGIATAPGRLMGEATLGAEVSLMTAMVNLRTRVDAQGRWELTGLPSSVPPLIAARKNEKTAVVNLTREQWSHSAE